MIGKSDWSGRRNRPFRYYMCGRENREGWDSCPTGKIQAGEPEQAMLKFVHERVLTMDFVTTAIADLEGKLSQQASSVRARLEDTHRRLDEVEKSINVLLGLAEQFGAGSAGARLVEREAERKELEAEMRYLEGQRDAQRLTAPTEILQALLTEMQETLWGTNIKAKRRLLKKIIVWVKLERESEGR